MQWIKRLDRRVLLVAGGLLVLALVFPPWHAYRGMTPGNPSYRGSRAAATPAMDVPIGWSFMLAPPAATTGFSVGIDWSRLLLEVLTLLAVAGVAQLALSNWPGTAQTG